MNVTSTTDENSFGERSISYGSQIRRDETKISHTELKTKTTQNYTYL